MPPAPSFENESTARSASACSGIESRIVSESYRYPTDILLRGLSPSSPLFGVIPAKRLWCARADILVAIVFPRSRASRVLVTLAGVCASETRSRHSMMMMQHLSAHLDIDAKLSPVCRILFHGLRSQSLGGLLTGDHL